VGIFVINFFGIGLPFDVSDLAPQIYYTDMVTTIILVVFAMGLLLRLVLVSTIRTRLVVTFLMVSLLPVTAASTISTVINLQFGQDQLLNRFEAVAGLRAADVDTWLLSLQSGLDQPSEGLNEALIFLAGGQQFTEGTRQQAYTNLSRRLYEAQLEGTFAELFIMLPDGEVVVSTDRNREGLNQAETEYFQFGLQGSAMQVAPTWNTTGALSVFVAKPIIRGDARSSILGVLVGRADTKELDTFMHRRSGVEEADEVYLVSADGILVGGLRVERTFEDTSIGGVPVETSFGVPVMRSGGIEAAIEAQGSVSGLYENYARQRVFGVYRWLPNLEMVLVVEQAQREVFRPVYNSVLLGVGAALILVMLSVVVSLGVTRSIAGPLSELTHTAAQIAAGDLDQVVKVGRKDEIGVLARSFNEMTARLHDLINTLEERVAARTLDLEKRTTYLEASAEVTRAVSLILNVDQLVQQVVDLIKQRFDLYYVGLFLLDEVEEWAVLKAGTGEVGRAMLARGHRIRTGEGMIGWCVAHAQSRIALDVGEDAVRLATKELPETRSEAALPLSARGHVIGALSVQSKEPAAFDLETIAVFQTLADQVAIALENARLFAETQAALEAAGRAYGELSREAWSHLLQTRSGLGYRSDEHGVTSISEDWQPEVERALQEEEMVIGDGKRITLAAPIKVRGEVIGVLDTYKSVDAGSWSNEELQLIESLTDQLGEALESARLYQDTQRRAAREQLISFVVNRMRSAADIGSLMQTTIREVATVLGVSSAFVQLSTKRKKSRRKDGGN
jgi:nitrate/nitrite-specific signal transduction histidine kinase